MKTFIESINGGKVSINDMSFSIRCYNHGQDGLAIQFIPDSKTLEFSKNEQVAAVMNAVKKKLPLLGDVLWYQIDNHAAGLIFRINTNDLQSAIEKKLK